MSGAAALVAAVGVAGCSEDSDCAFDDVNVAEREANPDGVAYPTGVFGAEPGELFPNFAFQGHIDSDTSKLSVVSLSDFFDPERKRHKLLNLMAAAMWCPVCSGQTDQMVQVVPQLRSEGLAVVQAIIDGTSRNSAPDRCDMEAWIGAKGMDFSVVFDVFAKRVGSVANITAVPWNALIDTSTMRVVDVGVGAPKDYEAYIRAGLAAVDSTRQTP